MIYDAVIMRTLVSIPAEQLAELADISRQEHISRAEAIRRAVAQYLGARKAAGSTNVAFGLWKDRETDGIEYEDRVRGEWQRP